MRTSYSNIFIILAFAVVFLILAILLKGSFGQGLVQAQALSETGDVFESSTARGRYSLLLAIEEEKSLNLPQKLADFGSPDVAISKQGFVSIFPPGIPLLLLPFYKLGSIWDLGQLATSFAMLLITVTNCVVLYFLARSIDFGKGLSLLASFVFLFASNSLAYSTMITQHQVTTLLMLILLILAFHQSWINDLFFWFVYGLSILIDIPNVILFLPICFYLVIEKWFGVKETTKHIVVNFNYLRAILIAFSFVAFFLFGYFNFISTGAFQTFGQILPRFTGTQDVSLGSNEPVAGINSPFRLRNLPQGADILLTSPDRGVIYYFPIFLLAFWGISQLTYQIGTGKSALLIILPVTQILLYASFGDPWGGWSYGARYLIPSFAILSLFLIAAVKRHATNWLFILFFSILLTISSAVSVLGAVSTTLIPPKIEAVSLGLDHTPKYALSYLGNQPPRSFIYQNYFSAYLNGIQFYLMIFGSTLVLLFAVTVFSLWELHKQEV